MGKSSGTTRASSAGSPKGLSAASPRVLYQGDYRGNGMKRDVSLGISVNDASAEKDRDILDSVMGQLSDGIWENSKAMEGYWRTMAFGQDEKGNVVLKISSTYTDKIPKTYYDRSRGRYDTYNQTKIGWSKINQLTDKGAKDWVANKIRDVITNERKNYDSNIGKFSADNNNVSEYLTRSNNRPITVADAYRLYKRLKG